MLSDTPAIAIDQQVNQYIACTRPAVALIKGEQADSRLTSSARRSLHFSSKLASERRAAVEAAAKFPTWPDGTQQAVRYSFVIRNPLEALSISRSSNCELAIGVSPVAQISSRYRAPASGAPASRCPDVARVQLDEPSPPKALTHHHSRFGLVFIIMTWLT